MLTPHSGVIPESLILCFTSLLCDQLLTPPQLGLPSPIVHALRPAFAAFTDIPVGSGVAIKRPELLPVVLSCFQHCAAEDREKWFHGATAFVHQPESAAALATVSDALIDVGPEGVVSSS